VVLSRRGLWIKANETSGIFKRPLRVPIPPFFDDNPVGTEIAPFRFNVNHVNAFKQAVSIYRQHE